MTAKRESGARRSRTTVRPGPQAIGVSPARADAVELAAALAAAERRAEEAERQLQHLHARYESLLAERSPDLAARVEQLESAFDSITDGVYVYDRDGYLIQRNLAARLINPLLEQAEYLDRPFDERITGFDIRDEAGRPLDPRDVPVARVLRGEVLMGATSVDTSMRQLDGRELRLNTTGAPVRDAEGVVQGAVIVTRDVTERRRLERRAHDALAALLAMAEILVTEPGQEPEAEPEAGAEVRDDAETRHEHTVAHRLAALTCSV